MDDDFLAMLDRAREASGVAFRITSGFRSPAWNRKVRGVKNSSHLRGYAADVACTDSETRANIIAGAIEAGFTRIGIASTFVHLDNDPEKSEPRVWLY